MMDTKTVDYIGEVQDKTDTKFAWHQMVSFSTEDAARGWLHDMYYKDDFRVRIFRRTMITVELGRNYGDA